MKLKPIRTIIADYLAKKLPQYVEIYYENLKDDGKPYAYIPYVTCEKIADTVIPLVKHELKKNRVYEIQKLQFEKVNDSLYVCNVPDHYDIQVYQYLNKWHIKIPFTNIYTFETEAEAMEKVQEILERFIRSFLKPDE